MSKKFDLYIKYHRKLLEKGIIEQPNLFKKQDLLEFDTTVVYARKQLMKEGILKDWEPVLYLEKPNQFLTLTEQQILFKTYLTTTDGNNILLEQISGDIPANVNAAMKSQINAVKELRTKYQGLSDESKNQINNQTKIQTKSRMNFIEELQDIEDEINGIYGKLTKGGFFSRLGKRGFGLFQRGMGKLFGAGALKENTVDKQIARDLFPETASALIGESVIEEQIFQDLFPNYVNEITAADVPAIGDALNATARTTNTGARAVNMDVINQIAQRYGLNSNQVADIAHRQVGLNVPTNLGTNGEWLSNLPKVTGDGGVPGGGVPDIPMPGPSGGASITPLKNMFNKFGMTPLKGAGKKGIVKAAGMGLGGKLAIGAGIAGLIAAGAAGIKMRNRRLRIKKLQDIFNQHGEGQGAMVKVSENPSLENTPTAPTSSTPLGASDSGASKSSGDGGGGGASKSSGDGGGGGASNPSGNSDNTEAAKLETLKKKIKSTLSDINTTKPISFSRQQWEELHSANDKNFGRDTEEARAGRDIIRKYHDNTNFTSNLRFEPDMKNKNEDFKELVALKQYGSVMESLKYRYRMGLISLKEYKFKKAKLEKLILREHVKNQINILIGRR